MQASLSVTRIFSVFLGFLLSTGIAFAVEDLDTIIATVDNEVITEKELHQRLGSLSRQLAAQGQNLPEAGSPDHQTVKKQMLNSLIEERLQLVAAENYGVTVDQASIDQAMASIAKQNNVDVDGLRAAVEAEGYPFERFQEDIRRDLLLSRLQQQMVVNKIQVDDEEIAEFLKTSKHLLTSNQEYRINHILIALPENPSSAEVQEAQKKVDKIMLQANERGDSFEDLATKYSDSGSALQGGDLGWYKAGELPTLFSNVIPKLKVGEVAGPIRNTSGMHLVKLSEVRGDATKQEVQQTQARHILIKTTELMSDEEAELRLRELKKRVADGEKFTDLARTHSEDPGSARKGGDLGWVDANSNLDETFFKEMEATSTGEISPPFKSAFGWHIVQVVDRRQQDQTKEHQENLARKMIQNSKFMEERQVWLNELRDTAHIQIKDEDLRDLEEGDGKA